MEKVRNDVQLISSRLELIGAWILGENRNNVQLISSRLELIGAWILELKGKTGMIYN